MLLANNVVGNQQDWANYITLSDEHKTPLLKRLPKGDKPVNLLHQYQADKYSDPASVAWPDGKDWDTFTSAAANRAELKARCQWFVNTCAVSKLSQDVTNAAGVNDELAREIPKKLTEMSRSIECAIGSDQAAFEDDGVTGNKCQGMGLTIQTATTDQLYATPAGYRPPTASIYGGTKADLNEAALKALLESQWKETGGKGTLLLAVGSALKQRISSFPLYIPSSVSTQSTSRVSNRDLASKTLGQTVDRYDSEFGDYDVELSRWLAHPNFGGTTGKADWRGYGINLDMWCLRWNQMPRVYKPEFKGGSYKAAMDTILMWLCKNPLGETKIVPSDA